MADVTLVDLVKITASTTGAGAVTLGAPVPGYRGVEALLNGAVYSYAIQQEAEYEVGTGTYLSAGRQFIRTPTFSSDGGTAIDLQPNAAIAFVATAEDILGRDTLRPLYGYGAPLVSQGILGQTYTDLTKPVTLYGPKTNAGWGVGIVLQGNDGAPGTNATYATLAAFQAASPASLSAFYDKSPWYFTQGNYTALQAAQPNNYVAANGVPLSTGAWVRQGTVAINFDGRSSDAKLREMPSVKDVRYAGGAKGDGINDDAPAWQACANANKVFDVPPGKYRFGSTVRLNDFQTIRGAGESAWESYTGGDFPEGFRSEIIVDGILALNARGTNCVTIDRLGFRAAGGKQSFYGQAPGFQANSDGIAITGSKQFVAENISAAGMQSVIRSHTSGAPEVAAPGGASGVETTEAGNAAGTTQMPRFSNFTAQDCERVWRYGTSASTMYTVRDSRISGIVIILHCGGIVEAHWPDGFRYEVSRNFQCTGSSIYIRKCPYVQLTGVCLFETGLEALDLVDCGYVKVDGIIGRSGDYLSPTIQRSAMRVTGCQGMNADLTVERPTGNAILLDNCKASILNVSVFQPYYKTGNMSNTSGVVTVLNSEATVVNLAVNGEATSHQIDLWADWTSEQTLTGNVSGVLSTGTVRAKNVTQRGLIKVVVPADMLIGASGVSTIATVRTYIPAGKKLQARSVSQTSPIAQLRTAVGGNAVIWATTDEPDGGTISLEDKTLYDNTSGPSGYYNVELTLRNPSGSTLTVPAGHEVRISTAFI